MRKILAVLLCLLVPAAYAATVNISYTAPTQNTDGTPITGAITYKIYGGVQNQSKVLLTTTSALTYVHTSAPNGVTYCYDVTANVAAVESAPITGCKAIPAATPNPPTNLTVTVAVVLGMNMSPVFKLTTTGKRSAEVAGYIRTGHPCTGNVLFYYRDKPYRKVAYDAVQFWNVVPSQNVAAACG